MASLIKRKTKSVDNILFEDPQSKRKMLESLLGYTLSDYYSDDRIEGLFRTVFEYSKMDKGIAHIRLNRLYEYFTVDHFNIFLGSFLSNFPFIHTVYINKVIGKNTNLVMEGIKDIESSELNILEYEDIDGNFKKNGLMTFLFKDLGKEMGSKKIKFVNSHIWNFRVKEYGNDIPDIPNHFNTSFPDSTKIYSYINFPPKDRLEYIKIVNFLLLRGKSKEVIMALLINQIDIYKWAEENIINNKKIIGDGSVVYVDKIIGMSTIKDIKYDEIYIYKIPKNEKFIENGEDDKNTLCISDPKDTQNKYKVYIKFQCVS